MKRTAVVLVALAALGSASAAGARVLLVGTYKGIPGQYRSIQAAVDAARPGDWILVGPGDYKTTSSRAPAGRSNTPAGVLITTPRVYLRGMNRNAVIVDGTRSGPACSRAKRDQNLGPRGKGGAQGLNGIMVWKAANVWVQNLTACNFLSGKGDAGNEIWWNGGDGSGKIGGHGYYGSYLNATNTFYKPNGHAGDLRDLLEQLDRRHLVPDVRQQLQRLRLLHRRLPAAVRPDNQPGPQRVQRTRLLGDQLRRPAGGQEFGIQRQPGRLRHRQRERRCPVAPERRVSEQRHQPDHPHPLVLGADQQLHPRQQQPATCLWWARPVPRRSGWACHSAGPATTR